MPEDPIDEYNRLNDEAHHETMRHALLDMRSQRDAALRALARHHTDPERCFICFVSNDPEVANLSGYRGGNDALT